MSIHVKESRADGACNGCGRSTSGWPELGGFGGTGGIVVEAWMDDVRLVLCTRCSAMLAQDIKRLNARLHNERVVPA